MVNKKIPEVPMLKELLSRCQKRGFRYLVLYFYPKDNTPGCTIEAKEFTQLHGEFKKYGAMVVGVSKDSEQSHRRFIDKHNLTIKLVSDPDMELIKAFDVLKPKKRFGKEYLGVVRSTFVIDCQTGEIVHQWRNVKARGHASDVLAWLKENTRSTIGSKDNQEVTYGGEGAPKYTREEVAKHNTPDDCWVIVNGKVYDMTKWLEHHSGGADAIIPYCGLDATAAFETKPHSDEAKEKLEEFYIGDLVE